jgi:hypothetical protein
MRTILSQRPIRIFFALGLLLAAIPSQAQTLATNWAAFNDHRPGTTSPNATTYDMRLTGQGGPLKDIASGATIPAAVIVTAVGTPDDFGANAYPNPDTPAYNLFNGIVDVGNTGTIGVRNRAAGPESAVTLTFTNLDPGQRYIFAGTSVRGNNYARRWTVSSIQGAASFENAHDPAAAVYTTENDTTGTLTNGQAAFNSGENRSDGALVRWVNIDPGPDGTFSVRCDQWIADPLPNGQTPDLTVYGYAFTAIYLAEVGEPYAPIILDTTQPTNRVVLQSRPTTLSVSARGAPVPTFQWYKDGAAIDPAVNPSATTPNLVIAQMSAADAGSYYLQISNPLGTIYSRTNTVGYTADTVAPRIVRVVGHPTLDKITVEFDEVMDSLSVTDAVNYAISGGITALSADIVPGGNAVVLTTDAQTPGTTFTVTATDVRDLANNAVASPNNTGQFQSWIPTTGCSGVMFEAFSSVGTTIPAFTNYAVFPNSPFTNALIQGMHSRLVFAADGTENYGGRMRALFIPLVSGNWRLYISSDDPSELWFNPTGSSPSGRQRVAFENSCCNNYQAAGSSQTSPAFPLVAGQAYYIELIYKENTGGDYGVVAARLEGTGLPNGTPVGAASVEAIDGPVAASPYATVGYAALPAGAAGSVSLNQNLSNISTEANRQVTLSVGATAPDSPYICYQWQKSDAGTQIWEDIPGATRASYTTPPLVQADDNGDLYRVVVGIPGASVTSATATLTVAADTTRPRVTKVVPINPSQVAVYFSESMLNSSATDPFPYEIDQGIVVSQALIDPTNSHRVDLMLASAMTPGTIYQLTVSTALQPLVDANNNRLDPDPTRINFTAVDLLAANPDDVVQLPTNTMKPVGSLTERGFAVRVVQVNDNIVNQIAVAERLLAGRYINPTTGQPFPNLAPTPSFTESNVIDYYGNGTDSGHVTPNGAIPGLPATAVNFALEVLTYLELQPGTYRMGVNSDDNFRVSPATSVADPNNAITIGTFDGNGRGQADTVFEFIVPQAGLYPFRLVFEQGTGGWGIEWFIRNLTDGTYTLVNGSDEIKAFVPTSAPRLNLARNASALTLSWVEGGTLQEALQITGPWTNSLVQANPQSFEAFGATLDAASEIGSTCANRTGTGAASVLLHPNNTITVHVTWSGLSGNTTVAHIHGPAGRNANASPIYDLTPPTGQTSGTLSQTITLVDKPAPFGNVATQLTQLRTGQWYINIHSTTCGGGEIRGQIEPRGMKFFRIAPAQ